MRSWKRTAAWHETSRLCGKGALLFLRYGRLHRQHVLSSETPSASYDPSSHDPLHSLSHFQAGFAPSRVLSLPPGTRSQWTNLQLKRAQPQTGLTAPNPRPMTLVHATWGQGQDRQQDVLDELLPKEVLEKVFGQNCRKITLALSNLKSTSAAEAPSASEGGGKTGKGKTGKPKFEEEDERKRQEMKSLEQGFGKELARRLGSWRVWQVK